MLAHPVDLDALAADLREQADAALAYLTADTRHDGPQPG